MSGIRSVVIVVAAFLVCLQPTARSFSFSPLRLRASFRISSDTRNIRHAADLDDYSEFAEAIETNTKHNRLSRRDALTKATAFPIVTAAAIAKPSPAEAVDLTTEPTRIELQVETDYLVRVLEYFDGDMRKVLSAAVRSPLTKVQIDPPPRNPDARDAILRALYSYEAPQDYVTQASWLKVGAKDDSFVSMLTKKRYKFNVGNLQITLSNLEGGAIAAVLSYPLAYAYFLYTNYKEEQEAIAKKAKTAAKKAKMAAKKSGKKTGDKSAAKKEAKTTSDAVAKSKVEKTQTSVAADDKVKLEAISPIVGEAGNVGEPSVTKSEDGEKRGQMDAYAEQYAKYYVKKD